GGLGADVVVAAGAVLDEEGLAELVRQPLRDQASREVGCAACGRGHKDADRSRGIGLSPRNARCCREGRDANREPEKSTALNVHGLPPLQPDGRSLLRTSATAPPRETGHAASGTRSGSDRTARAA